MIIIVPDDEYRNYVECRGKVICVTNLSHISIDNTLPLYTRINTCLSDIWCYIFNYKKEYIGIIDVILIPRAVSGETGHIIVGLKSQWPITFFTSKRRHLSSEGLIKLTEIEVATFLLQEVS